MLIRATLFLTALWFALQAVDAQTVNDSTKTPEAPQTDVTRPGTLSDKLGETNGVIRPTGNVDPGIHKDAPVAHPNSTPVIPPPGSRGDSGPVPK